MRHFVVCVVIISRRRTVLYAVASDIRAVPPSLHPAEQPVGGLEPTEPGFVSWKNSSYTNTGTQVSGEDSEIGKPSCKYKSERTRLMLIIGGKPSDVAGVVECAKKLQMQSDVPGIFEATVKVNDVNGN